MGANSSKLEKSLAEFPEGEHYFGFENFGNTCYANSVLQSLYYCRPFREHLLQYATRLPRDSEENLLTCLADLFVQVCSLSSCYLLSTPCKDTCCCCHDTLPLTASCSCRSTVKKRGLAVLRLKSLSSDSNETTRCSEAISIRYACALAC